MRQINVGEIGLGWFGEKHGEVLAGLPEAKLATVCTRTPARLAEVRAAFNVPKASTDYRDMLAAPEIDVVSVVTMWDQRRMSRPATFSHHESLMRLLCLAALVSNREDRNHAS